MHVKRSELDRLAGTYALTRPAVDTLLHLAAARPTRVEKLQFLARCFTYGGVLSLAAALVFFIAANWSRIPVFGRFAVVEAVMVLAVGVALLRPPPLLLGRAALFIAYIATGALLALFGQTYQTGADIYELFATWALLGLPFALLAQWAVASAAWVLTLNTALLLFCGLHPTGGLLWLLFNSGGIPPAVLVLLCAVLNLALWFAAELFYLRAAPDWVRRLILSCAFLFVTWAGTVAALGHGDIFDRHLSEPGVLLGVAAIMVAVSVYALRRKLDIYPLAVTLGSFIIVSVCWLARVMHLRDLGVFFVLALWLIASSTIGARLLMKTARSWRAAEGA